MHTDSNLQKRYKAMYCKNIVLVQGEVNFIKDYAQVCTRTRLRRSS